MGHLDGKVAFITGAAIGQGRSHAVKLAEAGADIIAIDLCDEVPTIEYAQGTADDLAETARLVEAQDRRIFTAHADVRDLATLKTAVDRGVAQLGRLDIVLANAGIASFAPADEITEEMWNDVIDINLTGVFKTVVAALPHLKANGDGGSIVMTSSNAGIKGLGNLAHYTAAKHGVVGLMKTLANELGQYNIRVNTIHPTAVNTNMIQNQKTYSIFRPDLAKGSITRDDVEESFLGLNILPVPWIEPEDISNGILYLVSDAARYVTGIQLPVDAGSITK
ncbi:NAD(P)-dependent oxidoreductase [Rhodococcus sp. WS4]|nr:NAD(P)-dependent oxidoreductase [Rhodococcus sp. WS4]